MSQRSTARGSRATTVNGRRRRNSLRTRTGLRHRRGVRIALFALATLCGLGLVGVGVVYAEYQNLKSQLPSAAITAISLRVSSSLTCPKQSRSVRVVVCR